MSKYRFPGSVGRRVKNSPLLIERLQANLDMTCSDSERDLVYAQFDQVASQAHQDAWQTFYTSIDGKIDPDNHDTPYTLESSKRGRQLAQRLKEVVVLPRRDHPKHASKHLQQRHNEFAQILDFYKEKRGEHAR